MKPYREAFVICPISKEGSSIRTRSDLLMDKVIQPILAGQFRCVVGRADYYYDDPEFMEVIHTRIARADLIIADLTACNANVMYELGHCHMMGLPTVLFIDSTEKLPSDIRHRKAIEYSMESLEDNTTLNSICAQFQAQVSGLKGYIPRPFPQEAVPRLVERFRLTSVEEVHTGRRDHYKMASNLIGRGPKRVLLMQRSSTMVLGPEAEWGDEAAFFEALWLAVNTGLELYHIVSKEGILRHLARPQSKFPNLIDAQKRLSNLDGVVAVPSGNSGQPKLVRSIPETADDIDLKPDRQARVLMAEFDEAYEGIMVMDLGGRQVSARIRGPEATALFHSCMDFYSACEVLLWTDMEAVTANKGKN
jgi:hypothetical protein